jgi:hypothetical protein
LAKQSAFSLDYDLDNHTWLVLQLGKVLGYYDNLRAGTKDKHADRSRSSPHLAIGESFHPQLEYSRDRDQEICRDDSQS